MTDNPFHVLREDLFNQIPNASNIAWLPGKKSITNWTSIDSKIMNTAGGLSRVLGVGV